MSAPDALSIARPSGTWRQLARGLVTGAFALQAFVDKSPGLSKAQGSVLVADAIRLGQLLLTLKDATGPTESPYAMAMARGEWAEVETALVRATTALSADIWLFDAPDLADRTVALVALTALQAEIRAALRARSPEER